MTRSTRNRFLSVTYAAIFTLSACGLLACGTHDSSDERADGAANTGDIDSSASEAQSASGEGESSDHDLRFGVKPEDCAAPRWALRSEEEALALFSTSSGCRELEECLAESYASFILEPHSHHCLHPDDPDFNLNPPPPRPPTIEPCEDEEHIQEVREARACLLAYLDELGDSFNVTFPDIYARSMDFRIPYYPECNAELAIAIARHPAVSLFAVCVDELSEPPE